MKALRISLQTLARNMLLCTGLLLGIAANSQAAPRTASVSGAWDSTATWGGLSVPGSADTVTINSGITVTVPASYVAQCITISFTTGTVGPAAINLADATSSLTASGAVTIQMPGAGGVSNSIDVGAGTFSAASLALSATTGGTRLSRLLIATGTATVTGNITSAGADSQILFSGAGTLRTGGTFLSGAAGTFIASTGTVNFNRAGTQTIAPFAYTFNNVILSGTSAKTVTNAVINGILSREGTATTAGTAPTYGSSATLQYKGSAAQTTGIEFPASWTGSGGIKINNAAGVTLAAAKNINGNPLIIGDTVANCIFSDGGFQLSATGTLNLVSGTLKLGSTTVATTFPAFSTLNISAGTVIDYAAGVAQTVATTPSYQNLTFSGTGAKTTAAGTLGIAGNWAVGSAVALNTNTTVVSLTGNLTGTGVITQGAGAITILGNWTNSGAFVGGAGGVTYNAAGAQTVGRGTYVTLNLSNAGLKTLGAAITVSGTLTIDPGVSVNTSASNFGLTLNGTFVNNGTFTANGSPITIGGTATQSIPGFTTTGTVSVTKTGGTATFTGNVNGGAFTLNGTGGTLDLGAGLTHTFTGTWTRTNGTLNCSSSTLNLGGTTSGTGGTFTAGTGTVNYTGSIAQSIAGITYNNLAFSGNGAKTTTAVTTVNGNLDVAAGTQLNVAGFNFTVTGITSVSGTLAHTSATGTKTFTGDVTVNSGGVWTNTANEAITLSGNLLNNGTFNFGTAVNTFGGTTTITNGVNATLNFGGASLTPPLTATASGNTVNYNGANQTVRAATYNNLTISGSGTKTTGGIIAVNGNLNEAAGAQLRVAGFNFTVTGTTSVSGTLAHTSTTGIKTFTGDVTINVGGVWTNTVNEAITLSGNLLNNGTFTFGTAVNTFGGTTAITNGVNATLNFGGASLSPPLTATASGNTVNYTGAAQTGKVTTYTNLKLSGSAAKTFATTLTVNGILSLEGTAAVVVTTGVVTYGPNATLQYNKTAAYTATAEEWITPFAAAGGVIIANTGVITMNAAKTFNTGVPLTINSGSTLNTGTNALAATTVNNSGTIRTQNTSATPLSTGLSWGGTVNYNATTGGQTIVAGTYNVLTLGNTSGTQTAGGALAVTTLNNNTNAADILNMGTNTLTVTTVNNTGTIRTQNTSATPLSSGLNWGGTVHYNATTGGQTIVAGTYNVLTLGNTSGTQTAGGALAVTTLNNNTNAADILNMGTNTLTVTTVNNTGTIRTQNTSATPLSTGVTWSGTVQYDGASQIVASGTYNNLTLSGSGAKSIASGTSVDGNLSIAPSGTSTASIENLLKLNVGALTLGGASQNAGSYGSTSSAAINKNNTYFAATTGYVLYGAPIFTNSASTSFTFGSDSTFTLTTDANPAVTSITKTGILPTGITFKYNNDGTATISGTPNSSGTFNLVFTAINGTSTKTQSFALTVSARDTTTTSAVDTDISISPNRHLFGVVAIGSCGTPISFTVRNAGATSRILGTLVTGGNDANQFSLSSDGCSGTTLTTGTSCTVVVSFCPTSTGSKAANLLIPSDDPETPTLAAVLYNYESLDEEAVRRLPPVLQNLNIPATMNVGTPYTINWSLLGYDDDYLSRIVFFDCRSITDGTCGNVVSSNFLDSGHMSADSQVIGGPGSWSYTNGGTVSSNLFNYSYSFTPPFSGPIVIRFFQKNFSDDTAGLASQSLVIPGNQNPSGTSYGDKQGRKLLYTITP